MHIHRWYNPPNIQRTTKTRQIPKTLRNQHTSPRNGKIEVEQSKEILGTEWGKWEQYAMFRIRSPKTNRSTRTPPLGFQLLMGERRLPMMYHRRHGGGLREP